MEENQGRYFCAHCGWLDTPVVIHKETCTIGANVDLNSALTALMLAREMLICNDAYGRHTAEIVDGELRKHGAIISGVSR